MSEKNDELSSEESTKGPASTKMEVDKSKSPDAKNEKTRNSHSQIEKRRRDKMNEYINDLCEMIPMPASTKSKPDKLTVLRLTVQHMKALQGQLMNVKHTHKPHGSINRMEICSRQPGSSEPLKETNHKPGFMSDSDLCNLITEASRGFILVVECDRGEVVYITDSVEGILNITQADMLHNIFYDFVHSDDVANIKKQLSTITNNDTNIKTDIKEIKSDKLCPGAKRSFLCLMKTGVIKQQSGDKQTKLFDESRHVLVSFEGYLKSWPPSSEKKQNNELSDRCCLVVVGRPVITHDENTDYSLPDQILEFETRHRADGVFTRVDKSFTTILGYYPKEIIGHSLYSYFHIEDVHSVASHHNQCVRESGFRQEIVFRLRAKTGHYVPLRATPIVFRNPFSNEVDFLVFKHVVMAPISSNNLLISEKRRLEKENENSVLRGVSSDHSGLTEDMKSILRKMSGLDSNEDKLRKRDLGSSGDTKGEHVRISPEYLGAMIAEHAKNVGKALENNPPKAQYTIEPLLNTTTPQPTRVADQPLQTARPREVQHHQIADFNHDYPREENGIAHSILMKQLEGIQGAIDAMLNHTQTVEDEEKLMKVMDVLGDDDELNSFEEMPWIYM